MTTATKLSRRLLVGAAGAALTGCASAWPPIPRKPTQAPPTLVTDIHTHMFNAADLPAAGFIKYTVLRPYADRGAARALVDLIVQVVKPLAPTVLEERDALRDRKLQSLVVNRETFARGASDRARGRPPSVARLAARAPDRGAPRGADLDQGYNELGSILAAAFGDAGLVTRMAGATRDSPAFEEVFRRAAAAADGQGASQRAAVDRAVTTLPATGRASATAASADRDFVGSIVRTFAWVVVMLQPRTTHLARYVKTYAHNGLRPVRIVNLLVDMGAWLQGEEDANPDGPEPAASIPLQVEFWKVAADHYAGSIEVLTFAPYCPLQHAYDRRDQRHQGQYLARLEGWYRDGLVAGYKCYPPMGWFPTGNRGRPDSDYVGSDGIRGGVVKAWNADGAPRPLGDALEDALADFHRVCRARNIPILAHAGPSNVTAGNFIDRPNPAHWKPVAEMGVRLMLGHFALDARDFVAEMKAPGARAGVWAIASVAPMIKAHDNVFIDISYVNEVLGEEPANTQLADEFYAQLFRYGADPASPAKACDPDFSQIVYGSDWIMLHREADSRRYLQIARDHLTRAPWPAGAFENIISRNADRFLARTT